MPDSGWNFSKALMAAVIPIAVLLIVAFFLPWVTCWQEEAVGVMGIYGQASGADLLAGRLGLPYRILDALPQQGREIVAELQKCRDAAVPARSWFILSLLLPAAMLVVSGLSLAGKLSPSAAGRILVFLGIGGVAMLMSAIHLNYTDVRSAEVSAKYQRAENHVQDDPPLAAASMPTTAASRPASLPSPFSMTRQEKIEILRANRDMELKEVAGSIASSAAPVLWLVLLGNVLAAVCGLLTGARRPAREAESESPADAEKAA